MFGGSFNRLPFNRPASFSRSIYSGGTVEIVAEVFGSFKQEVRGSGVVEIITETIGSFLREMLSIPEPIDITVEVIGEFLRELNGSGQPIEIVVEVLGDGYRTHTDSITFTGVFAPGDKIIMDSDRLKMTKNGQNALEEMTGDFFDLNIGNNEIRYTDDQGNRSVLARVTFPDKFV